jgi:YggT family protein
MGGFLVPILEIVNFLLRLYWWVVIASAVASWLIAARVINTYNNRAVAMIVDFLHRATEPLLRPIRRILPIIGGFDLSPLVLLLGVWLVQMELTQLEYYLFRI